MDLVNELSNSDPAIRERAAKGIGNAAVDGKRWELAVPGLTQAAGDDHPGTRVAALWALSQIALTGVDVAGAADALFDAVQRGTPDEVHWASAALSAAGLVVRERLLARVEALGIGARKGFLTTLAKSGADIRFSMPLLAKMAADADTTVRHWAASAMVEVVQRNPDVMAGVAALMNDGDVELSSGGRKSLAVMGWKEMDLSVSVPALLEFVAREGDGAAGTALMSEGLRCESEDLIQAVLGASNVKTRLAALLRLNRVEGGVPVALENRVVALQEPMLKDKGKNIREEAAFALTMVAVRKRDAERVRGLARHRNKEVRWRAVLGLRRAAEAGLEATWLVPLLAGEVESSADEYVRWTVACGLGTAAKLGIDLSAVRGVLEAGRGDADARTAEACREALGG